MTADVLEGAHETPIHVFVSYAREDKRWLDPDYRYNLIPFLTESLRRYNVIFWFDTELKPGDEFKRNIDMEIDQAQIAILIVSQHFLNSEFIEAREMSRISERAQQGKMIVVPVLVEPCDWSDYPFLSDRQMVPSSPLIDYTVSDPSWAKVKYQILDGIKAQLKRIREVGQVPPPLPEFRRAEPEPPQPPKYIPPQPQPQPQPQPPKYVAPQPQPLPGPPPVVPPGPYDYGKVQPGPIPSQNYGQNPLNPWQQPVMPPPPPPTPTKIPAWVIGVGVSVLVVAGIYALVHKNPTPTPAPSPEPTPAPVTSITNACPASDGQLQTYTSDPGRFCILFPGSPETQTHPVNLPGGTTVTLYQIVVSLDNDNIAYTVMYNDYPSQFVQGDPQTILQGARDGATKGRTLISDEVINLNGVPGRSITATGSDGYNYAAHLYLDGARLYQVVIVANKDHPATYTEEFLNSFRITQQ
jgi:hypothetical protein